MALSSHRKVCHGNELKQNQQILWTSLSSIETVACFGSSPLQPAFGTKAFLLELSGIYRGKLELPHPRLYISPGIVLVQWPVRSESKTPHAHAFIWDISDGHPNFRVPWGTCWGHYSNHIAIPFFLCNPTSFPPSSQMYS